MPSIIVSTTPRALEQALIGVIMAIVPTDESHRDAGWTPTEGNRAEGESSSRVPRLFYIETIPGGFVPSGITGNGDSECYLSVDVTVDYRVFEEDEVGTLLAADQWDIYDAVEAAINVVEGLTQVSIASEPSPEGDGRYRFPFTLQYMRARRF